MVLHKSSGYNTCRQCIMERWGSDFSLDFDISEEDAINRIAKVFAQSSNLGSYEAYLIGIIESKHDKYDNGMLTPTEQVVYAF
jgi:hypothetical protein